MSLISTDEEDGQLKFHPAFSRDLLCHSDTACKQKIDNTCPDALLGNLRQLSNLLGRIQQLVGDKPLKINSGYRCERLNLEVGGVPDSQHCQALAADIVCPQLGSAHQLARLIADSDIEFDQLILEFGRWVHVSTVACGSRARREILTLSKDRGYEQGIK
ncbi:MAG: D-Ala-D-Ala carboxypeptidase family metallohydrolase [Limnobacter sp.]|nr:D-Ala-D-Ala carboxypeptidase family metallohydrolase [Limnobacter sp.]